MNVALAIGAIGRAEISTSSASVILGAFLGAGLIFVNDSYVHAVHADAFAKTDNAGRFIALTNTALLGGLAWSWANSIPNILLHEAAHVYLSQSAGVYDEPPAFALACQWVSVSVGNCLP